MWLFNERRDRLQGGMVNSMQVRARALLSVQRTSLTRAIHRLILNSTCISTLKFGMVSKLCCGVSDDWLEFWSVALPD